MEITLYQNSDHASFVECTQLLQDYIASLDKEYRERSGKDFDASAYAALSIKEVNREGGIILVAKEEGKVIGYLVASLAEASEYDRVECFPKKDGKVYELFVHEDYRRQKIGLQLMQKAEEHFKKLGCDGIQVDCFAPNVNAHQFYQQVGYEDRLISMLKKL